MYCVDTGDAAPREFVNSSTASQVSNMILTFFTNTQPSTASTLFEPFLGTGLVCKLTHIYAESGSGFAFNGTLFKDCDFDTEKTFAIELFTKMLHKEMCYRQHLLSLIHDELDWNIVQLSLVNEAIFYKLDKHVRVIATDRVCTHGFDRCWWLANGWKALRLTRRN
jgi:hypothetical protein